MAYLNDFSSRFRKGLANPFAAGGRDWCPRCHQDVATQTEHAHRQTTYVYRRRCQRCGEVIARGVHDNVPTVEAQQAAVRWTLEPGADRR